MQLAAWHEICKSFITHEKSQQKYWNIKSSKCRKCLKILCLNNFNVSIIAIQPKWSYSICMSCIDINYFVFWYKTLNFTCLKIFFTLTTSLCPLNQANLKGVHPCLFLALISKVLSSLCSEWSLNLNKSEKIVEIRNNVIEAPSNHLSCFYCLWKGIELQMSHVVSSFVEQE